MLETIRKWAQKSKEESYKNYLESEMELDADFYQGEYSAFIRLIAFLEKVAEDYKDDFK